MCVVVIIRALLEANSAIMALCFQAVSSIELIYLDFQVRSKTILFVTLYSLSCLIQIGLQIAFILRF